MRWAVRFLSSCMKRLALAAGSGLMSKCAAG
jgi:hypothetical protein